MLHSELQEFIAKLERQRQITADQTDLRLLDIARLSLQEYADRDLNKICESLEDTCVTTI